MPSDALDKLSKDQLKDLLRSERESKDVAQKTKDVARALAKCTDGYGYVTRPHQLKPMSYGEILDSMQFDNIYPSEDNAKASSASKATVDNSRLDWTAEPEFPVEVGTVWIGRRNRSIHGVRRKLSAY